MLITQQKLSPEEAKLFRMYGKVPNRKDLLQNKMKVCFPFAIYLHPTDVMQERKYFDSGDYALSKAGKASDAGVTSIGREHPDPEKIPHHMSNPLNPLNGSLNANKQAAVPGQNSSPIKESSYLHRETSASDMENEANEGAAGKDGKPAA